MRYKDAMKRLLFPIVAAGLLILAGCTSAWREGHGIRDYAYPTEENYNALLYYLHGRTDVSETVIKSILSRWHINAPQAHHLTERLGWFR